MRPGLKNPLMRVTNLLLYLSFCGLIGTGALMQWKLVPGSEGGHGLTVLDMTRHEWADIHFWFAIICVATTLTHLILNWAWLKKIASSGKAWRLAAGLIAGALLIFGIYALPLKQAVKEDSQTRENRHEGRGQQRQGW